MTQDRFPFVIYRMLPVLAGVLVLSAGPAQAACDLPIRPPEPDASGQIPEQGYAGPPQAEGSLQFDRVIMKFVECQNGLWVPQDSIIGRNVRIPRRITDQEK